MRHDGINDVKSVKLRNGSPTDRKPPEALFIHSALIIENDKIKFINGLLPILDLLPVFVERGVAIFAKACFEDFLSKQAAKTYRDR